MAESQPMRMANYIGSGRECPLLGEITELREQNARLQKELAKAVAMTDVGADAVWPDGLRAFLHATAAVRGRSALKASRCLETWASFVR